MEIKINAVLFDGPENIVKFPITVDEKSSELIIKKLESERNKIIDYIKDLKSQNKIKSIFRPKNKQIQPILDDICKLKKEIKKTIEKLKTIYK